MELKHYLNGTEIEEPIGFDSFQTKVIRGEYHGMSLELSVNSLEFYGTAYGIIKAAYEADIDGSVVYQVKFDDGGILYSGSVDMSTYSEKNGEYSSISCKVGDIGAKTTFNNRTEKDVDLNTDKTIDGEDLQMQAQWRNIVIPLKHLKFTNKGSWKKDVNLCDVSGSTSYSSANSVAPDYVKADEFGRFADDSVLFVKTDDFDTEFGANTTVAIEGLVKLRVNSANFHEGGTVAGYNSIVVHIDRNGEAVFSRRIEEIKTGDTFDVPLSANINTGDSISLVVTVYGTQTGDRATFPFTCNVDMLAGSKISMVMYDNLNDNQVSADMLPVHNALNVVTGAISENELSVKSDWYGGLLSTWNRPTAIGGGHFKAITNGYKIRGLFTDEDDERNMPISFKELITSLSAIDCIGWGFSRENGTDYVRVERWNWFYNNNVVLTIENAADVTKTVDTDKIVTELQIGYKKYEDVSAFNSIDSVHGERVFSNSVKVLSKKRSELSSLIADTYCIEETRRAKELIGDTESFKYDENIFILELAAKGSKQLGSELEVYVPNNILYSSGVDRQSEQYNVQLSPRRCAERWRSLLFSTTNRSAFRFTSGKINYNAAFKCKQSASTATAYDEYLEDCAEGSTLDENAEMQYTACMMRAEKKSFSFPITDEQYKAVIANPYGLVSVNGVKGWISEFTYSFYDGMADFTIIPKAN